MRVAVVDDDAFICESLKVILGAQDDIDVVAMGKDGDDAVRLFDELHPDVMLLDIQMPGRDGLSAAREILARSPQARVVFLTTFSDDEYLVRALRYGARGYLIKQDVAAIAPALRAVMNGQTVLEGEVLARVSLTESSSQSAEGSEGSTGTATDVSAPAAGAAAKVSARPWAFAELTDREFEVVQLVAEGLDNREIAATAFLSEGTVRNHISSILAKLHLKNRTQIAVAYYRS